MCCLLLAVLSTTGHPPPAAAASLCYIADPLFACPAGSRRLALPHSADPLAACPRPPQLHPGNTIGDKEYKELTKAVRRNSKFSIKTLLGMS